MGLSNLLQKICLTALLNCSGEVPLKDTLPPNIELTLAGKDRGATPALLIIADDSSGLERVELHENFQLLHTFPMKRSFLAVPYIVERRDGSFTYMAVAYDRAGNKRESTPIDLLFFDGLYFRKGIITQDKQKPTIDILKVMEGGVIVGASDPNSCMRELQLYDKEGIKVEIKRQESPNCNTLGTRWQLVIPGEYRVEAVDFAGNKSSQSLLYTP